MLKGSRILCSACALVFCLSAFFPVVVWAEDAPPEVGAEAYIVMDAATGQVLIEKNSQKQEYPASITKIVTLGLALEAYPDYQQALQNPVEVSYGATHSLFYNSSHVALTENEVVSFGDLLYATQIRSANDAANVLAEYLAGSNEAFADRMNQKVTQLGLQGSHFVNPSGLPNEQHYTTAYDMARLTRWALSVPGFRDLFGATKYVMGPTNKQVAEREFYADNLMLLPESGRYYEGIIGGKQGFTTDAEYTLATCARRGDVELICIVLKCSQNDVKYDSTQALLDYCFNNFQYVDYNGENIAAMSVPVFGGGENKLGEIEVKGSGMIPVLLHNKLTAENITAISNVPERYVIGQNFYPTVQLRLTEDSAMQYSELTSSSLAWDGLDAVLANNTNSWNSVAHKYPTQLIFAITSFTALFLLVAARVLFVRYRRYKRRMLRLAAARSQMPIAIGSRPSPRREGNVVDKPVPSAGRRPARAPIELKVAYRQGHASQPRRAGRGR